jgi:NADH-ubiquinone oxidoreductase chain 5
MYLLIILLPFLGSCTAGLLGRYLGFYGSSIITTICIFLSSSFSLIGFYKIGLLNSSVYLKLRDWLECDTLHINWGFLFDSLSISLCCVITFVSALVHLYSIEYMAQDPHLSRFMSYLSFFTFFMLVLVTADNFVQMFVGWEGVGLCSYLLINFWFSRIQANKAAIKAMILNRIGDFGIVVGILIIFITFKSVDYATVFALVPVFATKTIVIFNMSYNSLTTIGTFLFIGAIGKSAQLGLHTWLPDAMEAPTPVSALIHAATMVTAGVFLIARSSPIYEFLDSLLEIINFIGASTAFFAASVGLVQNDVKKVIAYSTCSQLGYMIFVSGLSSYSVGIFHLCNHAFFKAVLFLGGGSIIHSVSDEQDMRKMGGLKKLIPYTYSVMIIGSLALAGFPFLTGFYSKDLILEVAYGKYSAAGHFSYCLGSIGAFLTSFYSTRLIYLTFNSRPNGNKFIITSAFDSSYEICLTLSFLTVPSIFIGFFTKEIFVGLGSDFWANAIFIKPVNMIFFDAECINYIIKILPIQLSFFGILSSFLLFIYTPRTIFLSKKSYFGLKAYNFLNKKWFFDKLHQEFISQHLFTFGYLTSYKLIDRGIFEIIGPYGLNYVVPKIGFDLQKLQSGYLYHYILIILIIITVWLTFEHTVLIYLSFPILTDFDSCLSTEIISIFVISLFFIQFFKSRAKSDS